MDLETPVRKRGRPAKSISVKKSKPEIEIEPEIVQEESDTDDELVDPIGEEKITKDGFLLGMEFNFGFLEQVLFYRRKGISISNVHTSKTSKSIVSFFTRRLKGIRI
jgi:hypothetical protein